MATAIACAHVLSFPRSRAAMTICPLERGEPQARDEELPRDDRRNHPRRDDVLPDQHDHRREDEHLVGNRVEERSERRGLIPATREPAVDLIRRHRDDEHRRRPVLVVGKIPREEDDDDGDREARARVNWSGSVILRGEYAANMASVHEGAGRQPWRDRGPDLPHAPRARIGTVAVYSEADRGRLHTQRRRRGLSHRAGPAAESYLRVDVIVETALRAGAEAIHPGYGFLAENAGFARAVEEAGLIWIGPPPAAIELMGRRRRRAARCRRAGVPIIPGTTDPVRSVEEVIALGDEIGYPLAIKAAAGGGGKGMKIVVERVRGRASLRGGAAGRAVVLRGRRRLRRALPRGSAPRRGADARRRARQRDPPRRARLHDPAPPPEARRGDALAGRRRRAPRADRRDRGRRGPRRRLPIGRDDRGLLSGKASTTSWR